MHSINTTYICVFMYLYMHAYVDFINDHTMFIIFKALLFPQLRKCLKWTVKSTEKFFIIIKVSLHCGFFFFFPANLTCLWRLNLLSLTTVNTKDYEPKLCQFQLRRVFFFTIRLNVTTKHVRKLKKGVTKAWGSLCLVLFSPSVIPEDDNTIVNHSLKQPEKETDRRAAQPKFPLPHIPIFWKPGKNEVWEKSDLMTTRELLLVYSEVSVWKIRSIKCLYSLLLHDLETDEIVKRWLTW